MGVELPQGGILRRLIVDFAENFLSPFCCKLGPFSR